MSDRDDRPDRDDSFASRWSRRKQQVAEEHGDSGVETDVLHAPETPAVPLGTIVPDGSVGRMQTRTEADRLAEEQSADGGEAVTLRDEDMPAVETLDESSDFSGFMSPGVSDKLRKLALRKLFAGAGFNIRDGLDDYDDDFTSFAPLGDIVTCDMKHRAEMEAAKREEEERAQAALEQEQREALAGDSEQELAERPEAEVEQEALETEHETQDIAGERDDLEPDERVGSVDQNVENDLPEDTQVTDKS